jgi:hypothetical protein
MKSMLLSNIPRCDEYPRDLRRIDIAYGKFKAIITEVTPTCSAGVTAEKEMDSNFKRARATHKEKK